MEQKILNGWKEISTHLERGVRTAQRWELQFGMPVHRPASKRRTAVVALADELDTWLVKNRSKLGDMPENGSSDVGQDYLKESLLRLEAETKELAARLWQLEMNLHDAGRAVPRHLPRENHDRHRASHWSNR